MSKVHWSLYIRESQKKAIDQIADAAEVDLNKSQVARTLIDVGLENSDLSDHVDPHTQILNERNEWLESKVKVDKLRMGFPGRVRYHIKNQFESGLRPEDLDSFGDNLKRDAVILWPDDPERVEKEHAFVDQWIDTARAAIEASSYSPLSPEQLFGSYAAIAEAVEDGEAVGKLPEIVQLFGERFDSPEKHPQAVAEVVAKDLKLSEDAVSSAIEELIDKPIRRLAPDDLPASDDLPATARTDTDQPAALAPSND